MKNANQWKNDKNKNANLYENMKTKIAIALEGICLRVKYMKNEMLEKRFRWENCVVNRGSTTDWQINSSGRIRKE